MALTLEATYENGVFVPVQEPPLANHDRVRLTVEPVTPVEPCDAACVQRRRERRIRLAPDLAQEIASSPEFDPDGL